MNPCYYLRVAFLHNVRVIYVIESYLLFVICYWNHNAESDDFEN